ncbi:hypothetical protein D3C87_1832280 [compost metagenome]
MVLSAAVLRQVAVIPGMTAHRHSMLIGIADRLRVMLGVLADEQKVRCHSMRQQNIDNFLSVLGRAVVKG